MKNEQLKRLIKEEIKNILKEGPLDKKFAVDGKINYGSSNTGQKKITSGGFNLRIALFLKNLKRE